MSSLDDKSRQGDEIKICFFTAYPSNHYDEDRERAKEIFKKIVNYDYAYSHIDAISLEEEGLIRCDEWWDESLAMDMYDGYDPIVDVIHISGTMMPYIYGCLRCIMGFDPFDFSTCIVQGKNPMMMFSKIFSCLIESVGDETVHNKQDLRVRTIYDNGNVVLKENTHVEPGQIFTNPDFFKRSLRDIILEHHANSYWRAKTEQYDEDEE